MNPAVRVTSGPLGAGHPPVSRALDGASVPATQSLLVVYDELLADVRGQTQRQGDDIANRAALLRTQLERRVVGELGLDVHSFALSSLTAYLGQSVRLYLHGFYDAAIVEASSRVAAALRGRLLSLLVWNRLNDQAPLLIDVLRQHGALADPAAIAAAWRERREDGLTRLPLSALVGLAEEYGVLDGSSRGRVATSLRALADKRDAIAERDADQGRQITLGAVDSGRCSGGPGAAHTEPLLGYYLTWGSSLHLLLADAVVAVCLVLKGAEAER
ncbi:MAG TPA: hypothetical protein VHX44_11610 [Planctomycetota bacterium]|nr:hypothetical protein [Planctomycetota bacterium]